MDKRGFTFFSDAVNIVLIIFILIIFFSIMYFIDVTNFNRSEEEIGDICNLVKISEHKYTILNLLRTQLDNTSEFTSNGATLSDLVIKWHNDASLYDRLSEESRRILDNVYGTCYTLLIDDTTFQGVNPYDSILPDLSSFSCVDFHIDVLNKISICLDVSSFENKLQNGGYESCF